MKNTVQFQQHIRTSSKVRRGYRTYQYTGPMDEVTDNKLSGYGVYASTPYADMSSVRPEDRPELFLFYNLDVRKVVCKSVYIGFDLHSYPPRSGNYISHALVADNQIKFNPAEIYEKANWKTAECVAKEDSASAYVPDTIPYQVIETDTDYYEPKWFNNLIVQPNHDPVSSEADLRQRQKMLMAIIDAVLKGAKVFIIDKKEKLLNWTMTLLQVFPVAFVFEKLTIGSFANSSALLDICQVLCFETESTERVRRLADKAIIIDFNNPRNEIPSEYARIVVNAINTGQFSQYRREVFPMITNKAYTPELFNQHADFYDQLSRVRTMDTEAFKAFFITHSDTASYVNRIVEIATRNDLKEQLNIIWRVLLQKRPPTVNNLTSYIEVSKYNIPGITDEFWMALEQEVSTKLSFSNYEEVKAFFNITKLVNSHRNTPFYNSIIKIVKTSKDQTTREQGLIAINEFTNGDLTIEQKREIENIREQIEFIDELQKADIKNQYRQVYERYTSMDEGQRSAAMQLLRKITWKDFFEWAKDDKEILKWLYRLPSMDGRLPMKELASCLLEQEALNATQFKILVEKLSPEERKEFIEYIPPAMRNELINSLGLDGLLFILPGQISQFLSDYASSNDINKLWRLCEIVHYRNTSYPAVIERIKEKDPLTVVFYSGYGHYTNTRFLL